MKRVGRWHYQGDVNMLDYGGTLYRQVGKHSFQFIVLTNMDDACGRDNEGRETYVVELRMVDLEQLSPKNIEDAMRSCGYDGAPNTPDVLAFMCQEYGCHAPLEEWSGNNAHKLLREARKSANEFRFNESALAEAMERPVNKIGSTAAEFMRGDIHSAMERGILAGRTDARIMGKMYGADETLMDDARPVDWLPFFMGYMDATGKQDKVSSDDLAPEYLLGYERGQNVIAGTCKAPSWIKEAR